MTKNSNLGKSLFLLLFRLGRCDVSTCMLMTPPNVSQFCLFFIIETVFKAIWLQTSVHFAVKFIKCRILLCIATGSLLLRMWFNGAYTSAMSIMLSKYTKKEPCTSHTTDMKSSSKTLVIALAYFLDSFGIHHKLPYDAQKYES